MRRFVLAPSAREDLHGIAQYVRDAAGADLAAQVIAHLEEEVSEYLLSVTAEERPGGDYACVLEYGLPDNTRRIDGIFGVSGWQSILLGFKTLYRELESFQKHKNAVFYWGLEDARCGRNPASVQEIFSHMTPAN